MLFLFAAVVRDGPRPPLELREYLRPACPRRRGHNLLLRPPDDTSYRVLPSLLRLHLPHPEPHTRNPRREDPCAGFHRSSPRHPAHLSAPSPRFLRPEVSSSPRATELFSRLGAYSRPPLLYTQHRPVPRGRFGPSTPRHPIRQGKDGKKATVTPASEEETESANSYAPNRPFFHPRHPALASSQFNTPGLGPISSDYTLLELRPAGARDPSDEVHRRAHTVRRRLGASRRQARSCAAPRGPERAALGRRVTRLTSSPHPARLPERSVDSLAISDEVRPDIKGRREGSRPLLAEARGHAV